jgi:beta-lactamase regulating signal transducer with metallopeptidase domain
MAELNVEPKKSSNVWWIILIIIIILIILYFVFRKSNNTNGNVNTVKDSTGMLLKEQNTHKNNIVLMSSFHLKNESATVNYS